MRPRLLLVPFVTELEWETILPRVEEWAAVAAYDPPGVGSEPLPDGISLDPGQPAAARRDAFLAWRAATARRGIEELERRGWESCVVVADSYGTEPAVRLAEADPGRVTGLALGHAALSHRREGPRAPVSNEIWEAMTALLRTDTKGFISYGIAQMTQGSVSEEQAARWLDRFPEPSLVRGLWEVLSEQTEPVGDRLRELGLPLLLAEHRGCLAETREGYEDIVAAFPEAATVSCPEACAASPAFAEALREFATAAARAGSGAHR